MNNEERKTMNGKPVFSVPVKTVMNLHSGFEKKLLCDGPTFSTGDACAYRCSFCYVPSVYLKLDRVASLLKEHGLRHEDVVIRREHAVDVLRSQLLHPNGIRKFKDPNDRRIIYSSPAVDVAANMELVRETIQACTMILANTSWQIRLLSKSNLLPLIAETLATLGYKDRVIYGVSTGTLDDGIARAFELDTPKPSKRLASLRELQDAGFRTFGMICPSLPLDTVHDYGEFARAAYDAIRGDRCEHVYAEVINVRGDSMVRTVDALRSAGFPEEADRLQTVADDRAEWEGYNRMTFTAHADAYADAPGKLRYLTYTTAIDADWWKAQTARGAVLL